MVNFGTDYNRFSSLSQEDRVLALTTVDSLVVNALKLMMTKLTKYGKGKFTLVDKLI